MSLTKEEKQLLINLLLKDEITEGEKEVVNRGLKELTVPRLPIEMYIPKVKTEFYLGNPHIWRRLLGIKES